MDDNAAPDTTITIGDKVRSFDFESRDVEGERACYIEGRVMALIVKEGCTRYAINVTRHIFGGKTVDGAEHVYPPVNGSPTLFGSIADGVVKLDAGDPGGVA